jgi:hypothetical protein
LLRKIKTFFGCFIIRRLKPQDPGQADVVGAFSFAFLKDGFGRSNKEMARVVEDIHKGWDLPIMSQWEIAYAVQDQESKKALETIIEKHREEGKYLDTLEVAEQMAEQMKKRGRKKILVVAHPLHVWRAVKILQKLGVKALVAPLLWSVPFEPKSEQWWTRNRFFWTIKEIPIRLGSLLKGWI